MEEMTQLQYIGSRLRIYRWCAVCHRMRWFHWGHIVKQNLTGGMNLLWNNLIIVLLALTILLALGLLLTGGNGTPSVTPTPTTSSPIATPTIVDPSGPTPEG